MSKISLMYILLESIITITVFMILFFDKTNSVSQHSKDMKSYFLGAKNQPKSVRFGFLLMNVVWPSNLITIFAFSGLMSKLSMGMIVLLFNVIIIVVILFPLYFMKFIVIMRKVFNIKEVQEK